MIVQSSFKNGARKYGSKQRIVGFQLLSANLFFAFNKVHQAKFLVVPCRNASVDRVVRSIRLEIMSSEIKRLWISAARVATNIQ